MKQTLARDIINALRDGTVPGRGLSGLAVGIDEPLNAIREQLDYVASGKTAIRFIEGSYGSGKTFLCSVVREEALNQGFVVSTVVVSPDAPLGKLSIVLSRIIDGIRTKAKPTSTAVSEILEKWLLSEFRRAGTVVGSDKREQHRHVLRQVDERLKSIGETAPSVARVVKAYYAASLSRSPDLCRAAVSWLRGSHSVPLTVRKELGIRGDINQEDPYSVLKAIAIMIKEAGYRGFVIVFDEAETIQRMSHKRQRDDAYEVLRVLLDGAGENFFPACLFVVTGTEHFFQDPYQGIQSYEALADRIRRPDTFTDATTTRQPILHLTGLKRDHLAAISRKVRDIHGTAYDWEARSAVQDDYLDDVARQVTDSFGESIERLPRAFLREIVNICDVAQEHGVPFGSSEVGTSIENAIIRIQSPSRDRTDGTVL
jgi:hypothetical protein